MAHTILHLGVAARSFPGFDGPHLELDGEEDETKKSSGEDFTPKKRSVFHLHSFLPDSKPVRDVRTFSAEEQSAMKQAAEELASEDVNDIDVNETEIAQQEKHLKQTQAIAHEQFLIVPWDWNAGQRR